MLYTYVAAASMCRNRRRDKQTETKKEDKAMSMRSMSGTKRSTERDHLMGEPMKAELLLESQQAE
jgi:hypothetical protein